MKARVWLFAAVGGALLGSVGNARAEDSEAVRVAYVAPATCPTERDFTDRLRARATRVRPAWPGERATAFEVHIERSARGARGTLTVTSAAGARNEERVFESDTCEDVVTAVALAAALTTEPESAETKAPEPRVTPPPPRPPPLARERATLPPKPATDDRWRFALAALGSVESGLSPELMLALPVFAEVRAPWVGHPSLRAGFAYSRSGSVSIAEGAARFTWIAGMVDACPYTFERGIVALSPCARFEAGALSGEGERVVPSRSETRSWLAAGAVGRLRVSATRTLFFELEGGARAPLVRDRFYVQPDVTVFRAPPVAWLAGVGVGAQFP